jgi:hypothetical protein
METESDLAGKDGFQECNIRDYRNNREFASPDKMRRNQRLRKEAKSSLLSILPTISYIFTFHSQMISNTCTKKNR